MSPIHTNKGIYITGTLVLPNYTTQKRKTAKNKLFTWVIPICSQFSFNLAGIPLEHVSLVLQVKAIDKPLGKKTVIGRVVTGGQCTTNEAEQEHWKEVLSSKGKMICREHRLHF